MKRKNALALGLMLLGVLAAPLNARAEDGCPKGQKKFCGECVSAAYGTPIAAERARQKVENRINEEVKRAEAEKARSKK